MSRITKEIANATAIALLKPKKEKINKMKTDLKSLVSEAVISSIPSEIINTFKANPKFFKTTGSFRFKGSGFNYEYFDSDGQLPKGDDFVPIATQAGHKILSLSSKINDAESSYRQIKSEIEVALYAFRTYANVEKEFPEAFALLPNKVSQAVMVNIDSIRKSIA